MTTQKEDATIGKKIRSLRLHSGMTQEDLSKELNVTRQALSNWERDINEPDISILKKLCNKFGLQIDELVMNTLKAEDSSMDEKVEKEKYNKYNMAIGLFYAAGLFLGIGIFFIGGFITMTGYGWAGSLFAGLTVFFVFGLFSHAMITLKRKDR